MFPLHDRTRRLICHALFLLCGVVPTTAALGWSVWMRSDGPAAAVRARMETALGLKVAAAKITFPRPGCTLLAGVELADPETGQTVASSRLVEISGDAQDGTIFASQPEFDATSAIHLKALLDGWLRRPFDSQWSSLRFAAAELTLRWPGGAQTFVDCNAQLESTSSGNSVEATLGLANYNAALPIHLQWQRSEQSGQPENNLQIQADGAPLLFPLIAVLAERENHCGPHSTIEGMLSALETPDGWQTELAGRLENIDLYSAVSQQFPHQLSGTAELTIKRAILHAGRLEAAEGSIRAGPGTVSPSLLSAAAAAGLARSGTQSSVNAVSDNRIPGNAIAYDELAADFALNDSGFAIHGQCGGKQSGAVMRRGDEVLLADSNRGPVPVVALVKMLVPDSRVQVPATRQTDWLLNLLPVPDVVPGDPQAVPQARLRGGKNLH